MNVIDVIEDDDVTLCVGVEFPVGRRTSLHIHGSLVEHVQERQPLGGAEAGSAVVHDAVGADVFRGNLVHTAAAEMEIQLGQGQNTALNSKHTKDS